MEIVHELNQLDYGGVERVIKNIIKYDKKNIHTIIASKDGPFRKELESVGAKVIVLEDKGDESSEVDMSADIIHVHSGGGFSKMAYQLGKSFPVVETIHSPVRSAMQSEFIRKRVGVSGAVSRINHDCGIIHNGLDLEDFNSLRSVEEIKEELRIPLDRPVIGRLGRLGKDKGLEDWLLTCYELQCQGLEFTPLIVGGPAKDCENYVAKLKLMAASLPVKGVIWAGHKSDPANYLQVMDVFLYPSPTEGFGLVFAEAMLSDAVVVTYETDVTKELFGGYSILTKNTIKDLANGVKKALNTDMRDALLGIQYDFVKDHYNAEVMSSQYQELYESCKSCA